MDYVLNQEKFSYLNRFYLNWKHLLRYVATFTVNILIYCDYLTTVAFHLKPITYFLVTMLTVANNHSKRYVSCWPTKSNIPKISSSCVATTSVLASIEYTASMTNVSRVFILLFNQLLCFSFSVCLSLSPSRLSHLSSLDTCHLPPLSNVFSFAPLLLSSR